MNDYKENEVLSYQSDALVEHHGTAHVILMWWDLQMDKDGEIVLSMAPKWMDDDKAKRNEVIYSICLNLCSIILWTWGTV